MNSDSLLLTHQHCNYSVLSSYTHPAVKSSHKYVITQFQARLYAQ